jgi:hypothetical protein
VRAATTGSMFAPPADTPGAAPCLAFLSVCAGGQPPSQVQTNRDFPEFAVKLLDYYGSVVRTERGVCTVTGARLGSHQRCYALDRPGPCLQPPHPARQLPCPLHVPD